jgi:maltose O-acetyltransferase
MTGFAFSFFDMKHQIRLLWYWLVRVLLYFMPDHPIIMRFRGWLYSLFMPQAGKNFQVAHNVIMVSAGGLTVGDNVYLAYGCVIIADKDVTIGDNVMFGPLCLVASGNHVFRNGSYRWGEDSYSPIVVGNGSWIGGGGVLLPGAKMPPKSVLAANSTLTKDFSQSPSGIYGGSPAKFIKINDSN